MDALKEIRKRLYESRVLLNDIKPETDAEFVALAMIEANIGACQHAINQLLVMKSERDADERAKKK